MISLKNQICRPTIFVYEYLLVELAGANVFHNSVQPHSSHISKHCAENCVSFQKKHSQRYWKRTAISFKKALENTELCGPVPGNRTQRITLSKTASGLLGQETPQVCCYTYHQDQQPSEPWAFRKQSTFLTFLHFFTVIEDSNLAHALPLPSFRGCRDGVLGDTDQDTECGSRTRVSTSQACPSCSHNTAKQPLHASSPKAMLCQMSGGRFAAHNKTTSQMIFTREGRGE